MAKEIRNIFKLEQVGHKIHVLLNGDILHKAGSISSAQETVRKRRAGLHNVTVQLAPGMTAESVMDGGYQETSNQFSIEERFLMLADLTEMIADGQANSLIVLGEGGIGKTHTVMDTLFKKGFEDLTIIMELTDPGSRIRKEGKFRFVKGYSTAKGLFRTLYENNGATIIFDDCDSVMKDSTGLALLKTALDTHERRVVTWNAEEPIGGSDLPKSFEFTGCVIFISNLAANKLDQAFRTRALRVDLSMTKPEIIERMHWIIETQDTFLPNISIKNKKEALTCIEDMQDVIQNMSLRTLILACRIRHSNKMNWKDLASYSLTR